MSSSWRVFDCCIAGPGFVAALGAGDTVVVATSEMNSSLAQLPVDERIELDSSKL